MNTFVLKFLMAALLLAGVSYASDYAFVNVISDLEGLDGVARVIDKEYVPPSGRGVNDSGGGVVNDSGGGMNSRQSSGGSPVSGQSLQNPLKSQSITEFLLTIIEVLLIFALPIIVLFIMYAGFLYVTARGDETKIKKAHAALTWSIVGGVIVLGAELIINVIQETVRLI